MTLPYRCGVGIMLINQRKQVFVAKRIDMTSEAWQMPQGGIDAQETPLAAAVRELYEETNVKDVTVLAESHEWHHYDLPPDLIPRIWGGQYRGQKQKWFVMRFDGTDTDIDLATHTPEFSEWKWIEPVHLPDVIVPFKRPLYQLLVEEFREYL